MGSKQPGKYEKNWGPDTLIIIISAYDWSDIEKEAREAGADAFISKPMLSSSIYQTLVSVSYKTHSPIHERNIDKVLADKRILVAEDNDLNQEIMTELLKQAGAKVDIAKDGD